VILKTSISGMRLLPAGPLHQHATELLASERMATLVKELSSRYPDRVIIFDTPPLLLTTEAQAMAHLMGQIVVVVHAAHTPQSAVLQALESLEGTTSISIVLNKTRTAMGEEYGGYGYY
jgi:protein-tyrosine kinase